VPVTKDLAADISDAKLRVSFFDIEVVEMINRLNILEIELGLPVEDLAQAIIANLRQIVKHALNKYIFNNLTIIN